MKAACQAAPNTSTASSSSGLARAEVGGRFDAFKVPRFFTKVYVAGYDVGKAVVMSKKQEQQRKAGGALHSQPAQVGPGSKPSSPATSASTQNPEKDDKCPAFAIEL